VLDLQSGFVKVFTLKNNMFKRVRLITEGTGVWSLEFLVLGRLASMRELVMNNAQVCGSKPMVTTRDQVLGC
jgi:hypothetical protein